MLFKLYTEKDVRKLVARLKEEYDGALEKHREAEETLRRDNRALRARVLELEGERKDAIAAFGAAERERENAKAEGAAELENLRRELDLLLSKCRLLLSDLERRDPKSPDAQKIAAFLAELGEEEEEEESGFDLEEVTSPKGPLDLKKLCLELGLTEDDDEG